MPPQAPQPTVYTSVSDPCQRGLRRQLQRFVGPRPYLCLSSEVYSLAENVTCTLPGPSADAKPEMSSIRPSLTYPLYELLNVL